MARTINSCENGNCPKIKLWDDGHASVTGYDPDEPAREITIDIPAGNWQRLLEQLR
jgi:hypothetical protein